MDLVIEQGCPSCGAAIVLHETDRLIVCPYCEVRNYRISERAARYSLPDRRPAHIAGEDLVYLPYLRFKGSIYQCRGQELRHAIIDTTRLAIDSDRLPVSLGLRPQAMKMMPLTADHVGRFIPQTVEPEKIFSQAFRLTTLFSQEKKQQLHHRAFIGETLSRIYLPLYRREDMLVDAVTNLEIGPVDQAWQELSGRSLPFRQAWQPRFLSTLCPHCAAPMTGEADALVLFCRNCETMWEESEGRFAAITWGCVPAQEKTDLAIPFWKIALIEQDGGILRSFADFLRLTNQPVVVRPEDEDLPLAFWLPACKLPPAGFLQTAHSLTVSQRRIAGSSPGPLSHAYPVNLSRQEAGQALKSVLASAALAKKTVLPLLPSLDLQPGESSLVYLPFRNAGHDMIERQTSVAITAAALKFGRKL
jgi:hypothetical protein